jgi:hypothetical protein
MVPKRRDESHIQGTSKRPSKRIEGLSVLDAHHFLSDNHPSSASDTGLCELVVARYVWLLIRLSVVQDVESITALHCLAHFGALLAS